MKRVYQNIKAEARLQVARRGPTSKRGSLGAAQEDCRLRRGRTRCGACPLHCGTKDELVRQAGLEGYEEKWSDSLSCPGLSSPTVS